MSTVATLRDAIGQTWTYDDAGLRFAVQIVDVKVTYGRVRYQIVPIAGSGSRWVDQASVRATS